MKIAGTLRNRLLAAALFAVALAVVPVPAHAASKEIIELQTQVQQLLDMVQRLQSTFDNRLGVLQNLAQQTADQAKVTSAAVADLQQKLNAQNDGVGAKVDTVSGQVQSLNDSVDELKSRVARLNKAVEDMQTQMQNVQVQPQPGGFPNTAPNGGQPPQGSMPSGQGATGTPSGPQAMTSQTPPLQDTYQSALRDYNAAHYDVASSEFSDVLNYYPNEALAGNAEFYLGEIAYRQQKFKDAIKAYNGVLENFSGSPKAPAAQLRKGLALLQMKQNESGVHELRSLIQRYPQTPEALQARSKLNAMGIRINPR